MQRYVPSALPLLLLGCPKPPPETSSVTTAAVVFPAETDSDVPVSCIVRFHGARAMGVTLTVENASASPIRFAPREEHLPRTTTLDDGSVVIVYGYYDAHRPYDPGQDIVLEPGRSIDLRSALHVQWSGSSGIRARGTADGLERPRAWRCGLRYRSAESPQGALSTSTPVTVALSITDVEPPAR